MIAASAAPDPNAKVPDTEFDRAEPIRALPKAVSENPARVALGEALFNDPRLSHGNDRACASCHDLKSNGANTRKKDTAPDGQPIAFNTTTVFNAALNFRQNWTGDARTLEEQAEEALLRPDIMAATKSEVLGKLRLDADLAAKFHAAYGRDLDWESVLDAIASFERTLITPDSRFDLWLRGDQNAISAEELEGYRLFKSAGCVSCHQGVNVGGNLYEKNGIFSTVIDSTPQIFKVPSLRNVAVTPPYFHNARTQTLGEAVTKMAKAQLGRTLTQHQVDLIVGFLNTLTGRYRGHELTVE